MLGKSVGEKIAPSKLTCKQTVVYSLTLANKVKLKYAYTFCDFAGYMYLEQLSTFNENKTVEIAKNAVLSSHPRKFLPESL